MKRACLIGSSYSAAPIFFALKRRGLHVTVCGACEGDPCHEYADSSSFIDYSNQHALLEFVRRGDFDYLVPSCNDFAYVSGSYVADVLGRFHGFDRHETTMMMHTKHLFRAFCEKINLPSPQTFFRGRAGDADGLEARLRYPVLVKPADSFSGRGVTRLADGAGLRAAVDDAGAESRTGMIVVESFVDGALHSHTAFIQDGTLYWDSFVDEFCVVYPYQVDCSYHPSRLSEAVRRGMRAAMTKLVQEAGLQDGLLHTQFIADGDDFVIIECMRRAPGDLYGQLIERATGVPHFDMYTAKFLGDRYAVLGPEQNTFIGRHTISVADPVRAAGGFTSVVDCKSVAYIPLKESGTGLRPAPFDKLGILFYEFSDRDTMWRSIPTIGSAVTVQSLEAWYG